MTREQYVNFRKLGRIAPIAWHYYKDNVKNSKIQLKNELNYQQFNRIFTIFVQSTNIQWNRMLDYYDGIFELQIVTNLKTNEILKII